MEFPEKGSNQWITAGVLVFIINLCLILISRFQLGVGVDAIALFGFAVISLITAGICSMGYFGLDVLSKVVLAADALGLIYMAYITTTVSSDGWSDFASLYSLLSMIILGMIFGVILQIAMSYYMNFESKPKKRKKSKKH